MQFNDLGAPIPLPKAAGPKFRHIFGHMTVYDLKALNPKLYDCVVIFWLDIQDASLSKFQVSSSPHTSFRYFPVSPHGDFPKLGVLFWGVPKN